MDITTGEPLFFAKDKFASGCGWPSFSRPIAKDVVHYYQDHSHGMERIEVRSRSGNAHLGHVFTDGPKDQGGPTLLYQFGLSALYSKRGNGARRLWIFVKSFEIRGSIEKAVYDETFICGEYGRQLVTLE